MTEPEIALRPLARIVQPSEVSSGGIHVVFAPKGDELPAIAEAAGIVSVESFRAELKVAPWSGSGFIVTGRIVAEVTQSCVVTLEPVATRVDETVDAKLVPPEEMAKYEVAPDENGEIVLDASALDAPDPIVDGVIDVGGLALEYFILGLEPYPRKPGAEFDAVALGVDAGLEVLSPFAALARLKKE